METLKPRQEVFLIYIKRLGLILVSMAFIHAITRILFPLSFFYLALFYCGSAILSVLIYRGKASIYYSILLYGLFGLSIAFLRTSDLMGSELGLFWGFLSMLSVGLLLALLTWIIDGTILNRRVR